MFWSTSDDTAGLPLPPPPQEPPALVPPTRAQRPASGKNGQSRVHDLEELVLADSGKDEFNEIFKLIFAKIWDEKEALERRKDKVVEFRKALDPEITYDRINSLFHKACDEWPGIFKPGEDIDLAKRHLQVCVGPIEGVRLMGSNLRIMDDAFEYLLPTEAKKKIANPPFAGEMKDRKMLARYELARPALKRAGDDKQPKDERDVLFIERILKMLKPGGRPAIVLPQGKFNNSSLAFIREWILKKARLLAVVGLHPNTFKPHTGTKTSVLFLQKYTQDQLDRIAQVHEQVAGACPDYWADIGRLLAAHASAADVPEDAIPEAVADLIAETFSEPETETEDTTNGSGEDNGDDELTVGVDEDPVALAEEKLNDLRAALLKAKQRLMDLESDREALEQQKDQKIDALNAS